MAGLAHDKRQQPQHPEAEQPLGSGRTSSPDEREQRNASDEEFERAADYIFRRYSALYKRLA